MKKPTPPHGADVASLLQWRKSQREQRRVMTWGEYQLWARTGDFFDCPTDADCFRGGVTIILDGRPPMFGGYFDDA